MGPVYPERKNIINKEVYSMSIPAKVTASNSGLSLLPRQTGHGLPSIKRETRLRISALYVVANVCSTYRLAPVKVPIKPAPSFSR